MLVWISGFTNINSAYQRKKMIFEHFEHLRILFSYSTFLVLQTFIQLIHCKKLFRYILNFFHIIENIVLLVRISCFTNTNLGYTAKNCFWIFWIFDYIFFSILHFLFYKPLFGLHCKNCFLIFQIFQNIVLLFYISCFTILYSAYTVKNLFLNILSNILNNGEYCLASLNFLFYKPLYRLHCKK